ncbi:MAG: putative sugar nucleotidyl transferase [Candidatus Margulisiibacteriota bacterium]|jgi:UDP-N-acetylglucosamine diphosphorylase/glucosamine-1-phosphate N-acetyltransferase
MYNLCIFEDTKYRLFLPLTHLRPAYDLLCGLDTLAGKIIRYIPHDNVILHCRPYLKDVIKQRHVNALINQLTTAGSCLFVNGRALISRNLLQDIELTAGKNYIYLNQQEELILAYLNGESLTAMKNYLDKGPINCAEVFQALRLKALVKKIDVPTVNYPWELIAHQGSQLKEDFSSLAIGLLKGDIQTSACLLNEDQIFIDKGSKIDAFSVLDASDGPIYISKNVHILPHSYLKGPVFIGDNCEIRSARITASSIGPCCKIGGEVKSTTILGYSNKAHDGFLGNSYLAEWINLGALTTNSNLKNNYSQVKVQLDGSLIDTNETFFGSLIGDHTKTGIGTLFNTGIVVGVGNNLFGGGLFAQKSIPSFSWGTKDELTEYKLEKFIETEKLVMPRRSVELTEAYKATLKYVFSQTANERLHFMRATT